MTYDPQHDKKVRIKNYLLSKKRTDFIQDATYQIDLRFYMKIPESFPNSKLNMIKWGFDCYEHPTSCDIDNLVKWILDCGNNILWPDDRHITAIHCEKFYSTNPRTEIAIMEIPNQKIPRQIVDILNIYSPEDVNDLIEKLDSLSNVFQLCRHEMSSCNANDLTQCLIDLANNHADKLKKISKKNPICDKTKL